jgi:hypothetical protein
MFDLKNISVVRCGIVLGAFAAFGGLFEGLIFAPILLAAPSAGISPVLLMFKPFFAVVALIGCPVFFGIFGFVEGALFALLYNISVRWTGGIRVTLAAVPDSLSSRA